MNTSRGVDRVPKRLRVKRPEPLWLVRHPLPRKGPTTRHVAQAVRCAVRQSGARDAKSLKSGRLRVELRPDTG